MDCDAVEKKSIHFNCIITHRMYRNSIRIILLLTVLLCCRGHGYANRIRVCAQCQYTSVKAAIAAAGAHDTVFILKGIYRENDIPISKPMVILGAEGAVIDAENKEGIFLVAADSVTISGLTLNNIGRSHTKDLAGIKTLRVKEFLFENNTFNNPFFAFHIQKSKRGIIRNNVIHGNAINEFDSGNGIHMWHCSNIEVTDNKVDHMRDGIYFEFVKHSKVSGNVSKENIRYGLHFMFSNNDEYSHNLFEHNGAGVAVMFSKYIFMRYNTFRLNWGTASYGLLLKEIYDAEIKHNTFEGNTIGINADGSTRINVEENDFINNGWAVKFLGACYSNKFLRNNFIGNAFEIAYKGSLNSNIFDKNFWGEYTGYDLDKDDYGDVPYRPVKLFSYVVNKTPETIVLLRSLFVDIINFSEKVSPIFTPDALKDEHPRMKKMKW